MTSRSQFIALVTLWLASCTLPVSEGAINWRFPSLASEGCPDISGSYYEGTPVEVVDGCNYSWCTQKLYPTSLYLFLTGGSSAPRVRGTIFETPKPKRELVPSATYISDIEYGRQMLRVTLRDSMGLTYSTGNVPLERRNIGCADGAIIIHDVLNHSATESGTSGISYSESRVMKMADGTIRGETWHGYQSRKGLAGRTDSSARDVTHRIWTFAPARVLR